MYIRNVLFLLISGISTCLSASDFYVSPSGNNSNPGSIGSPFKTISYGVSRLKSGDILYVRSGIYREKLLINPVSGSKDFPTKIMSYQGENPIIDGERIDLGSNDGVLVTISSDYVHFFGFEIRNSSANGIVSNGDYAIISKCYVHNCQQSGIGISGDFNKVEFCHVSYVCMFNKDGKTGAWGYGISARRYPNSTTISNCIVHDSWGEGISTFEAISTKIEENVVFDCFSVHIYVSDATDCLVQKNFVYMTKTMAGGSQVGIGHWNERNSPANARNTIINNIVYRCRRNFYAGNALIDLLVANNTFLNSTYHSSVVINNDLHSNSRFLNNIIIQEDPLPCINCYANPGLVFSNNLYNKSYDVDAVGTNDLIADPKFTRLGEINVPQSTTEYFKLTGESPAINKGLPLPIVHDDYFGNLRNLSSDIGAHEYGLSNHSIKVSDIAIFCSGGFNSIITHKGTLKLNVVISPTDATNKSINWSVVNGTGQATIDSNGLLTAVSDGNVTVRAASTDDSGISKTIEIIISNQTNALNSPPIIKLGYQSQYYSGNVGVIDASSSYDSDSDELKFTWLSPNNVPISSNSEPVIQFLTPFVDKTVKLDFVLLLSDGIYTQSQIISLNVTPFIPSLKQVKIKNIEASNFHPPNLPINIHDGDLTSIWSVNGDNEWLVIEFDKYTQVHHVVLAFHPIWDRKQLFDIFASQDGVAWESIAYGVSSCGFSGEPHTFSFPESKAENEFRYLKLLVHGNHIDNWSSISEIKIYGFSGESLGVINNQDIRIFPNPAKDYLKIHIQSPHVEIDFLEIFDLSGSIVYSKELEPSFREFTIPLLLSNGIYIIQLSKLGATYYCQKIILNN